MDHGVSSAMQTSRWAASSKGSDCEKLSKWVQIVLDFNQKVEIMILVTKLDHSALLFGYNKAKLGRYTRYSYGIFWIARSTEHRGGALGILSDPLVPLKSTPKKIVNSKCESCGKCFKKTGDLY